MGTRQPLFGTAHPLAQYEENAALMQMGGTPQTSAEFALSALVNCRVKTQEELHALAVEMARVASTFMYECPTTFDKIDEAVDMFDTAADLIESMKERDNTCASCAGTGEGRSDYQSCGGCGGKGWKA